jgi:hypothetical protein
MSTTAMVPSLIDDTEFLAQLDALDACDPDADSEEHSGESRHAHRRASAASHAPQRERKLPFWEERMREGAAAFDEIEDPEPAATPTALSRVAALLGLMLCTAAGAGAAALVFHDRLAHLLR